MRIMSDATKHWLFSVLSVRHSWRDLDRLSRQTESIVRAAVIHLHVMDAATFSRHHLSAFKLLESAPGHGWQQLHYDANERYMAQQLVSVIIYLDSTISTEFPLYGKETMAPAFTLGDTASISEQQTIDRLIRDEHFRSFPVQPGMLAIFSGTVCHRGPHNPNPVPRRILYFLFSPSASLYQDIQQRVPNRQHSHTHLSPERRWAIIAYHRINMSVEGIALTVGCSKHTVHHWLNHYSEHGNVDDAPRSGRKRKRVDGIKEEATAHPFSSTPRMLKAKLRLTVSKRTIRRRLNDDSLFGRVSRHFFVLTDAVIRKRLSFAHGYSCWSTEQWCTVLYSDEKIFTLGMHGRVWVQRPHGAEWQPQFCREAESHPDGINVWCCFSSHGVGSLECFTYNNSGSVMSTILNKHLIPTAHTFWPTGMWWLLWDNSPIHKAAPVQTWLHEHGVNCLELSPYSPDMNPTEHLFADLARRVEQRFPTNTHELEQAIHAEWALTDKTFCSHLATSMPKRIQAVINNTGHATKY